MNAPSAEQCSISLRVGDNERQQCIAELLNHHLDGRLDAEEYDYRERQALSAITVEELMILTLDLPSLEVAELPRSRQWNFLRQRTRGTATPVRRSGVRRLWPVAVLWSGAFVTQEGSTADWWHLHDDISTGFVMASFGFATHWVITKFRQ